MINAYDGLLRLVVAGIFNIVIICITLAPVMPVIVVVCMIVTPLVFVAAGVKSFCEFTAKRKRNISRDPRRR